MRTARQNKILELINTQVITTQEMLCDLLNAEGFKVTQATISRDIKELQLIKTQTPEGKYKYTEMKDTGIMTERFARIYKESIVSIANAGNLVVIKCLSGCANAAAEAIDISNMNYVVGTVAGDNTILIIVDDEKNVPALMKILNDMME